MLKIGSVRWRGKCAKHPAFDPCAEAPGAIQGGCPKCAALIEIYGCHQRMLTLMRSFAPAQKARRRPLESLERQQSLFGGDLSL